MRKRALATGLVLVLAMAAVCAVNAQTPFIAVFFDPGFSVWEKDCPGFIIDTLYVAGVNFNTMVTGAEFAIRYPVAITCLADLNITPITIGNTWSGISMGYPVPLNGFSPVGLCKVMVFWNCTACEYPFSYNDVKVIPHPVTRFLGWTDLTFTERPAVGLTSEICWVVSVEETTWGRVKALFSD